VTNIDAAFSALLEAQGARPSRVSEKLVEDLELGLRSRGGGRLTVPLLPLWRATVRSDDSAKALRQIVEWSELYLEPAIDPVSDEQLKRADELLETAGISMKALHARWARTLVEDMGRLAREGLETAERRKLVH
jgi:hypothetical protein